MWRSIYLINDLDVIRDVICASSLVVALRVWPGRRLVQPTALSALDRDSGVGHLAISDRVLRCCDTCQARKQVGAKLGLRVEPADRGFILQSVGLAIRGCSVCLWLAWLVVGMNAIDR